jgi:hypothetical protein
MTGLFVTQALADGIMGIYRTAALKQVVRPKLLEPTCLHVLPTG